MKKSTKIILTYVLLLLIGALTIYIGEIYVGKGGQDKKLYHRFTQQLSPFSVVVAKEYAKFRIEMGDSNSIDWQLPKEMSMKGAPAFVRNDTLFVINTPTGNTQDFVVRCKSLSAIVTMKSSYIQLINPRLDQLTVLGNGGAVSLDVEQYQKNIRIGQLDIVGKKMERIRISIPIKCLNAQLDSVELSTYEKVVEVNLKMVNKSSVRFNNYPLSRFKMEKDSTCMLKIY